MAAQEEGREEGRRQEGWRKEGWRRRRRRQEGRRQEVERARPPKKRSGAKRTPNAAFMKPMQPSDQLAASSATSRCRAPKSPRSSGQYIKRNGLQDAKNRRMINADENLRPCSAARSRSRCSR